MSISSSSAGSSQGRENIEEETSQNIQQEEMDSDGTYKAEKSNESKKKKDNGWYRVKKISGIRIVKEKNQEVIELKVHWVGYDETTWERFSTFIKDASVLVERFIV